MVKLNLSDRVFDITSKYTVNLLIFLVLSDNLTETSGNFVGYYSED